MRCREVRKLLPETRLGLAPVALRKAVSRHLERCPKCSDEARAEADLARAFSALAGDLAPNVSVAERVCRAVRAVPAEAREPVPIREVAWAGAAAAVAGLLLAGAGISMAPSARAALIEASPAIATFFSLLLNLGRSAALTLSFLDVFARAGIDLLTVASGLALRADPIARLLAAASVAGMLLLTTAIVGRDLRNHAMRVDQE